MNMKAERKKRVSFWAFFKALGFYGATNNDKKMQYDTIAVIFGAVLNIFLMGMLSLGGQPSAILAGIYFAANVLVMCFAISRRPSVCNLAPVSPSKKAFWFFLSCLLGCIIATVAIILFSLIMMLIIALGIFAVTGGWIFVIEASEPGTTIEICNAGYVLGDALALFTIGSAFLIGFIKKRLVRNLCIFLVPIVNFLPLELIAVTSRIDSGMLFLYFDQIPYETVYLSVYAVIAVAVFFSGIIRTILYMKPEKY